MMSHKILVYTGDKPKAGTDANVKILFHDEHGRKTPEFKLDKFFRNDFERGRTDDFHVQVPADVGFSTPKKIEFWRDSWGLRSAWYVDRITVIDTCDKVPYDFPIYRWIKPGFHYIIKHLDTCLPQFDEHKEQRCMELEEKRKLYQLKEKVPGLPMQVEEIPPDEKFAKEYRWDLRKMKYQMALDSLIIRATTEKWKDLESLKNIYITHHLPKPEATETWTQDCHFGDQRVAGVNPVMIHLCTEIPDKFGVADEMVKPFLEGMSLAEAIDQRRLFIVDLKILEDTPTQNETFVICAPVALFFETKEKQLLPVAIQLFQNKACDNPVFLPSDPPMTWLLAKMWYNNADSAIHQSLTHLGLTHLVMEGVSAITHRNLSPTHPMFKLLAPHFLYLIAINTLGLEALINEGGWVDSVQGIGIKGTFFLIAKSLKTWRMNVEGTIPEEIKQRGLLDDNVLGYYPYRDDVLLLYNAILTYVKKIVDLYYDSPDKLLEDCEIQSWAEELVKSKKEGGCGILGVPGNGHFTDKEQLILVLTSIISTCSLSHAAFNFAQYDSYGFSPNYPLMMIGKPPTDKSSRTEAHIVQTLPSKAVTLDAMLIVKLLSSKGTNSLGDFEVNFVYDPKALQIIKEFRADIAHISDTIKERNKTRRVYKWLDPDDIPNAISI